MQVCTSLQTDNHASTPPLCFLQAGCPSCRPTNSVKALKALQSYGSQWLINLLPQPLKNFKMIVIILMARHIFNIILIIKSNIATH